MKALFVISQLPYPPDTGAKIRTFNLIKNLSKKHSINLIAFGDYNIDKDKITGIKEFCEEIELVPKKRINNYIFAFNNLFSRYPYSVSKYYSKEMVNRIDKLINLKCNTPVAIRNTQYDLIHCDSAQMSGNVLKVRSIPKLLTAHNIESEILRRAAGNEKNIIKKIYLYFQFRKLKKYEIWASKQFDHIVTVSEQDKAFFAKFLPEDRIFVVPNGVDCEYFRPETRNQKPETRENSLVFTGSMDWLPNSDAMVYFIKGIYPLIKAKKLRATLTIVGRAPSERLIKLANQDASITITGRVEDVRPYVAAGTVLIVPLRIGGGTRLKILEAFAMEKPVVSTSIGCEGLAVSHGKELLVADTAEDFTNSVLEVLDDEGIGCKLALAGRKLAEEKYDYKIVAQDLEDAWHATAMKTNLPILLYHDICEDSFDIHLAAPEKRPYIINESEFERQMEYLHKSGNAVIIVFDDGLASSYKKALPILKKYGLKAKFFIIAGMVGGDGMMSWDEIKELQNAGMEIGSHSLTHRIPAKLTQEELTYEFRESKRMLENKLNQRVDYFSSPTGFYNALLPEAAKEAGYKAVFISNASLNTAENNFILNKTSIKRDYSFEKFTSIVEGDTSTFKTLYAQQSLRNGLKNILGPEIYNSLRRVVLKGAE